MQEPIVTKEATERMVRILDSNYQKANLKTVVQGAKHLTDKQRALLYQLLIKYEDIFELKAVVGGFETKEARAKCNVP